MGHSFHQQKKINDQQDIINSTIYKLDKVINRNGYFCKTKFMNVGTVEATPDIAKNLSIDVGDKYGIWIESDMLG